MFLGGPLSDTACTVSIRPSICIVSQRLLKIVTTALSLALL